jgi:hypothetical protein
MRLNSRHSSGIPLGLIAARGGMMARYLAGVLTVIAVGTLLIAYGLLNPRVATADGMAAAQTFDSLRVPVSDRVMVLDNGLRVPTAEAYAYPIAQRSAVSRPVIIDRDSRVDDVRYSAPVRSTRVVERAPRRDWKKTAMIVGGSTAAAAGLGGLIGGKKGALIGAALGGGAATIYEVRKR